MLFQYSKFWNSEISVILNLVAPNFDPLNVYFNINVFLIYLKLEKRKKFAKITFFIKIAISFYKIKGFEKLKLHYIVYYMHFKPIEDTLGLIPKTIIIWINKNDWWNELKWFFTFILLTLQSIERSRDTSKLSNSSTKLRLKFEPRSIAEYFRGVVWSRLKCSFEVRLERNFTAILVFYG